jgi:hypothetical protein
MAYRWSEQDQKIIDGTKKTGKFAAKGASGAGKAVFYKYAVPKNPESVFGKKMAVMKAKDAKRKPFWNRRIRLGKMT